MSGTPAEKIAEIEGLAVHYSEAGAGETIVYLHGAGGAPPAGASFVAMLAARHRVVIPSRPGFDDTPIGECATPADAARVMAGLVRATADGPVHVVAQSAGAAVATATAVGSRKSARTLATHISAAMVLGELLEKLRIPPDRDGVDGDPVRSASPAATWRATSGNCLRPCRRRRR